MNLLFRLSPDKVEGFESIVETKKFFQNILPIRDDSYFFHTKKMNAEKLKNGAIIFFSYNNYIVAKAIFEGEIKTVPNRYDGKFIHGHKVKNIEIIDSNLKLNTKIVSTRTTYIDSDMKKEEIDRVVNPTKIIYPDEIEKELFIEGAKKQVTVNAYERNTKARKECIKHYGSQCFICNLNFEKVYGKIGRGFIHVHHLKPLSEIDEEYEVNPIEDLRPVCPNCHAMLHKRKPAYSIEEIKNIINEKDL